MKIIDYGLNEEEPRECLSCEDEHNARNWIKLELSKGFNVEIELCDICYNKLEKIVNSN